MKLLEKFILFGQGTERRIVTLKVESIGDVKGRNFIYIILVFDRGIRYRSKSKKDMKIS